MTDKDRHAQIEKLTRAGHQFKIVGMRLAEPDARIEADAVERDPSGEQRVAAPLEVAMDVADHIVIAGIDLHGLRGALHVHGTDAGTRFHGDAEHAGIPLQAGDVVDDLSAQFDCPGRHRRLRCVDRDRNSRLSCQLPHDLSHTAKFLVGRNRYRVGPRALATDIEDVGPLRDDLQPLGNSGLDALMASAVGKAIGRDVDDPHHERPA